MPAPEATPRRRRKPAYRRRLRSRIILSFVLLGFGLTSLFAFATQWTRSRVENALVEDVMNKNIDEYARRYYVDPSRNPDLPFQQIRARVLGPGHRAGASTTSAAGGRVAAARPAAR